MKGLAPRRGEQDKAWVRVWVYWMSYFITGSGLATSPVTHVIASLRHALPGLGPTVNLKPWVSAPFQ